MNTLLRSSISSVLHHGRQWFGKKSTGVRILCYHRVNDERQSYLSVPVRRFAEQMDFLAREGYQTISPLALIEGDYDDRSLIITFDDGYRDNFENAFPILHRHWFVATIFCVSDKIGEREYLTAAQIQEMNQAGFSFGSHTKTHVHLPKLTPDQKKEEIVESKRMLESQLGIDIPFFCYPYGEYDEESVELVSRAGYLAACSNIPGANEKIHPPSQEAPAVKPRMYAKRVLLRSHAAKDMAKQSHIASERFYPYLLRRTEISAFDTLFDFQKKLSGAYDWLHQGLHWFRGRP